jgi:hypothetical protein
MSKLKCAYMYSTQNNPLPTRATAEKMYGAKILYGLKGKTLPTIPYSNKLGYVDSAFHNVVNLFRNREDIAPNSAQLVVFDNSIDEVFFAISAIQNTITKFSLDGHIIQEMQDFDYRLARLDGEDNAVQYLAGRLVSFEQSNIGDQAFFDRLPKYSDYLHEISAEVQRIVNAYKADLKALFSSGW